jgi:hypothetical protein
MRRCPQPTMPPPKPSPACGGGNGRGKQQMAEMQKIIEAEESDLFDVLARHIKSRSRFPGLPCL